MENVSELTNSDLIEILEGYIASDMNTPPERWDRANEAIETLKKRLSN